MTAVDMNVAWVGRRAARALVEAIDRTARTGEAQPGPVHPASTPGVHPYLYTFL